MKSQESTTQRQHGRLQLVTSAKEEVKPPEKPPERLPARRTVRMMQVGRWMMLMPALGNKLAYSVKEASKAIGVSEWYIREEIKSGALNCSLPRGRTLIPVWELIRYLANYSRPRPQTDKNRWT